jgi:hypothetical protein
MKSDQEDTPILEVTPGDVTIGSEGKVEIINLRLAEAVKAAVSLQKEQGGQSLKQEASNQYACGLNGYQCGKALATTSPTKVDSNS